MRILFIFLCSLYVVACGFSSKTKKIEPWGIQVAKKLDSIYDKEEMSINSWLTNTEKMRVFFETNQEKRKIYPTKSINLSEKIKLYKNANIAFYTDSVWGKKQAPFLSPISQTEVNLYLKKYQQRWDTTYFTFILKNQEDIDRNISNLQNLIQTYKDISYIIVCKNIAFKTPKITELGFEKGFLEVQAFVYNLDKQEVIFQFTLKTENKEVEFVGGKESKQQEAYLASRLYEQMNFKIEEYVETCCK
ncbi:MAG: hypothetical protein SFU27_04770 [Thermonemataceae bacterium]|nr:hypothetical protein [Thermonemataceae bacterium]